jgi:hypothetical protein
MTDISNAVIINFFVMTCEKLISYIKFFIFWGFILKNYIKKANNRKRKAFYTPKLDKILVIYAHARHESTWWSSRRNAKQ